MSQAGANSTSGGGGSGIQTIDGDVGSVTGSTVTLTGGTSGAVFTGSGTTMTESFDYLSMSATAPGGDGVISMGGVPYFQTFEENLFIGANAGNDTFSQSANVTAIGALVLNALTSANGSQTVAIGDFALANAATGDVSNNVVIGYNALDDINDKTCSINVIIGSEILPVLTDSGAYQSVLVGPFMFQAETGSAAAINYNVCLGAYLLSSCDGANIQQNVLIGEGLCGLSAAPTIFETTAIGCNVLQQFSDSLSESVIIGDCLNAWISGPISGSVILGSNNFPVMGDANPGLSNTVSGSVIIGNGIVQGSISGGMDMGGAILIGTDVLATYGNGTSGAITNPIFIGVDAVSSLSTGTVTGTIAIGNTVLESFDGGALDGCIVIGNNSLSGATGSGDIVNVVTLGENTLFSMNTITNDCTAIGSDVLQADTSGTYNTGLGSQALVALNGGSNNVALGYNAGSAYTSTESSNIVIGAVGTAAESNVVRIGTQGSSAGQQDTCFIAGITGATVVGSAVLCSATGQLGTISSSERYKKNIQSLEDGRNILKLRPVSFSYRSEKSARPHYGLIAEEVEKEFPELVVYDQEGTPDSVNYHEMPALLLAEIQKLRKELNELKLKVGG